MNKLVSIKSKFSFLVFFFGIFISIFFIKTIEIDNKIAKAKSKYWFFKNLPTIYVVTPTYERSVQYAELTRLQNTLRSVPKVFWIVIEDSESRSKAVSNLLMQSKIPYKHLYVKFENNVYLNKTTGKLIKGIRYIQRGSKQRNVAIDWLMENFNLLDHNGVVYFCDDDNSYNLRVFKEMRYTKMVSIWPVAPLGFDAKPKCFDYLKKVLPSSVLFHIDVASYSVNLKYLVMNKHLETTYYSCYASLFIKNLIRNKILEVKANNYTEIMVWNINAEDLNYRKSIHEDLNFFLVKNDELF